MAKDKKSFVLYSDLLSNIDHLTNEEKGILFNHLLEYVNDKKPILEDRLIMTAWKPIERQLKRDLIKFEEVKAKRSDAGKRSAELRALKSEQQTLTNSTLVESVDGCSTNPTDNDSVNVNVNVNDIINNNKSFDDFDTSNLKQLEYETKVKLFSIEELRNRYSVTKSFLENFKIKGKTLTKENRLKMINQFCDEIIEKDVRVYTRQDFLRHLKNWGNKQIELKK